MNQTACARCDRPIGLRGKNAAFAIEREDGSLTPDLCAPCMMGRLCGKERTEDLFTHIDGGDVYAHKGPDGEPRTVKWMTDGDREWLESVPVPPHELPGKA